MRPPTSHDWTVRMTVVVDVEVKYVSTAGTVRVTVTLLLLIASRRHRDRIGQQQLPPQPPPPPCYTARQLTAVVVSCPSFAGFETTPTFARNMIYTVFIHLINGLWPLLHDSMDDPVLQINLVILIFSEN